MNFEDIVMWFKEPANLPWIITGGLGILFLIFFILFIVKAAKLSKKKKTIRELQAEKNILAGDKKALSEDASGKAKAIEDLTSKLSVETAAHASAEEANKALQGDIEQTKTKVLVAEKKLQEKESEIESLKAEIAELKTPKEAVMLEPDVLPMAVEEAPKAKKAVGGAMKNTLEDLNNVAAALGIRKQKTKKEAISALKLILNDEKKVTKAQLLDALSILFVDTTPYASDMKSSLINRLKKELSLR